MNTTLEELKEKYIQHYYDKFGIVIADLIEDKPRDRRQKIMKQENLKLENSMYLGDGVYGHLDKFNRLWIVTSNGIKVTNEICLEDNVFKQLVNFYENQARIKEAQSGWKMD